MLNQATNLIFQYSENLAKKVIEENNDVLEGVSDIFKNSLKEAIKEWYIKEFIKELEKKIEEQ